MHLRKFEFEHVKTFEHLVWELPSSCEDGAGWHVIIGDNAAGKSSLLRAIALALVGPREAFGLRYDFGELVRAEQAQARIQLLISRDPEHDIYAGGGRPPSSTQLTFGVTLKPGDLGRSQIQPLPQLKPDPQRHIWGDGRGWFNASFGPMRRFSGGDKEHDRIYIAQPRLAAHLTLFGEDVALTEIGRWLEKLRFQQLEQPDAPQLLDHLRAFINQAGLLPNHTRLDAISSEGVFFTDSQGYRVRMEHLSDGFRSILCLAFELIRQLTLIMPQPAQLFRACDDGKIVVDASGVILIDEIDAHLHPSWQQRVGWWFREHFPKLQFIVTTHSPLVCHAADQGSVFKLPSPGTGDAPRFLEGEELKRLLYGNILDAYGTESFGEIKLSPPAERWSDELAKLNLIEAQGPLTPAQQLQRQELLERLPHSLTTRALETSSLDDKLDQLLASLAPAQP